MHECLRNEPHAWYFQSLIGVFTSDLSWISLHRAGFSSQLIALFFSSHDFCGYHLVLFEAALAGSSLSNNKGTLSGAMKDTFRRLRVRARERLESLRPSADEVESLV